MVGLESSSVHVIIVCTCTVKCSSDGIDRCKLPSMHAPHKNACVDLIGYIVVGHFY